MNNSTQSKAKIKMYLLLFRLMFNDDLAWISSLTHPKKKKQFQNEQEIMKV